MYETDNGSLHGTNYDNKVSSVKLREGCTMQGYDHKDLGELIFIFNEDKANTINDQNVNVNDKLTSYSCTCNGRLIQNDTSKVLIFLTKLTIKRKISKQIFFLQEYELVEVGKECGDNKQIKLSNSLSDPLACKRIADQTVKYPLCGEYFEINRGYCRCTPSDEDCAMNNDGGSSLYRIIRKGNQNGFNHFFGV